MSAERNRSLSKIPPLRIPLGRLEGYMNSETRRPSREIKVSITTRLQYDIINEDKHTRAWIHVHKNPQFIWEFQEIKRLEKQISVLLTQVQGMQSRDSCEQQEQAPALRYCLQKL